MTEIKLEELTKQELIELIKCNPFSYKQRDLVGIKWRSKTAEANKIMDEASKEMQSYTGKQGIENQIKWLKASEKFNKGLALADEADNIFKELLALK